MKRIILASLIIASATMTSWLPAEKSLVSENRTQTTKDFLSFITPFVTYGSFSASSVALPDPYVTFTWTTTSEINVARFKVQRYHAVLGVIEFYVNPQITGFPRTNTVIDETVAQGNTYSYRVCAVSSDQTTSPWSQVTEVTVNGVGLNKL